MSTACDNGQMSIDCDVWSVHRRSKLNNAGQNNKSYSFIPDTFCSSIGLSMLASCKTIVSAGLWPTQKNKVLKGCSLTIFGRITFLCRRCIAHILPNLDYPQKSTMQIWTQRLNHRNKTLQAVDKNINRKNRLLLHSLYIDAEDPNAMDIRASSI